MKIYLAADHAGFQLKASLSSFLRQKGYKVFDLGNTVYDEADDYPDFIFPLAEKVAQEINIFGIAIGKSGNGEAIVANKVKGIRAALCLTTEMAKLAREHNNANILVLGADFIQNRAEEIAEVFISTAYSNEERHKRRIAAISSFEQKS